MAAGNIGVKMLSQNLNDPKLLTMDQVRAVLGGVARSTVITNVKAGILPAPIKLSAKLFWYEHELYEALNKRRVVMS
jgi:predicted DNA-binding transcriptional regulator AlpA